MKMVAVWTYETLVSCHNTHHTASQPRKPRLEIKVRLN